MSLSKVAKEHQECVGIIRQWMSDMTVGNQIGSNFVSDRNASALIARLAQMDYIIVKTSDVKDE